MTAHRIWITVTVGMILLALASMGMVVADLNLLAIRTVDVTFHGDIAANPDIIAFLSDQAGLPVWDVSDRFISKTVRQYSQVKSHRITRHTPRNLNIDIELKTPVAVVTRDSTSFFLDERGTHFPADPSFTGLIPGYELRSDPVGTLADNAEADADMYRLVLTLAQHSFWSGYQIIDWRNHWDIQILHPQHGNRIRLQRRDFDIQLDRLNQYFARKPMKKGMEFDMRFRDTLVIRQDKGAITVG